MVIRSDELTFQSASEWRYYDIRSGSNRGRSEDY